MPARTAVRPSLIAAAAAAVLTVAGPAHAASPTPVTGDSTVWQVLPEQTPVVAGVPVRVALAGDATKTDATSPIGDVDPAAALVVLPPGVECPKSYAETIGEVYSQEYAWTAGDADAAPFLRSQAITFDQPGTYTACGYYGLTGDLSLADDQDATTLLYAPVSIEVQRPVVGLGVQLDGPRYPGATIRLSGTASSNAPETVDVQLNEVGQACESTGPANAVHDRFALAPDPIPVYGSRQIATTVTLPSRVGDYHLCLYAARDLQEGDPDLTADSAGQPGGIVEIREAPIPPVTVPLIYGTGESGTVRPSCRISPFAPKAGQRVTVSCTGIRGKIVLGLRKSSGGKLRHSRTLHLDEDGRGRFSTKGIRPGAWHTKVTWDGKTAISSNFYLKPTKKTRAEDRKRAAAKEKRASKAAPEGRSSRR